MLLIGIGMGLVFVPLTTVAVVAAPAADSGAASGLVNMLQLVARLARPRRAGGGVTAPRAGTRPACTRVTHAWDRVRLPAAALWTRRSLLVIIA